MNLIFARKFLILLVMVSSFRISAQTNPVVEIVSATYGRNSINVCRSTPCPVVPVGNRTAPVQTACANNKGFCNYKVIINAQYPDPAFCCSKNFEVKYKCATSGPIQTQLYPPEVFNTTVHISCYNPPDISTFDLKLEDKKAYLMINGNNFDSTAANNKVLFTPVLSSSDISKHCVPVVSVNDPSCPAPIEVVASSVSQPGMGMQTIKVEIPLDAGTGSVAVLAHGLRSNPTGQQLSVISNNASCTAAGLSGSGTDGSKYCALNNAINSIRHLVLAPTESGQDDYTLKEVENGSYQLPTTVIVPKDAKIAHLKMGNFSLQPNATLKNAGKLQFSESISISNSIYNEGQLFIDQGKTLTTTGKLENSATIQISGSLVFNGQKNSNSIFLNNPSGTITINSGATLTNSGRLVLRPTENSGQTSASLTNSGTLANNGDIFVSPYSMSAYQAVVQNNATFNNNSGATLNLQSQKAFVNVSSARLINAGTINIKDNIIFPTNYYLSNQSSAQITNTGTINNSTLLAMKGVNNQGVICGSGTWNNAQPNGNARVTTCP